MMLIVVPVFYLILHRVVLLGISGQATHDVQESWYIFSSPCNYIHLRTDPQQSSGIELESVSSPGGYQHPAGWNLYN